MHFYSSRPSGNSYLPKHKMGAKAHVNQPAWSTRRRNAYMKYLVIIGLVVLLYFNWNRAADEFDAYSPYTIVKKEKGQSPSPDADSITDKTSDSTTRDSAAEGEDGDSAVGEKFAIVTFTTSEKSYTYLSQKNKAAYADKHGYSLIIDYDAPESNDVGIMWHKFTMMERLIATKQYDWIWWIDFDTLLTNMNIKLSDIVNESLYSNVTSVFPDAEDPDWKTKFTSAEDDGVDPNEIDFLLTADCFPLNAGSMLVRGRVPPGRSTPLTTADFLQRVRDYHAKVASYENQLSEQDCIRDLLFEKDQSELKSGYPQQHVRMIPQWKINSFPVEIKCWDKDQRGFEKGTFAIHFAGAWAHVKQDDPTGYLMKKYEGDIVYDEK